MVQDCQVGHAVGKSRVSTPPSSSYHFYCLISFTVSHTFPSESLFQLFHSRYVAISSKDKNYTLNKAAKTIFCFPCQAPTCGGGGGETQRKWKQGEVESGAEARKGEGRGERHPHAPSLLPAFHFSPSNLQAVTNPSRRRSMLLPSFPCSGRRLMLGTQCRGQCATSKLQGLRHPTGRYR